MRKRAREPTPDLTFPIPSRDCRWTHGQRAVLLGCKQDAHDGPWVNRHATITETSAATVCGLNPYKGSDMVSHWTEKSREKTIDGSALPRRARVSRGARLEALAQDLYCAMFDTVVEQCGVGIAEDCPWISHSPGGIIVDRESNTAAGLIRIKAPQRAYEEIPITAMCQMQMGMYVHHLDYCDFIVYVVATGNNDQAEQHHLDVTRVSRSDEYIERLLDGHRYFEDCLHYGIEPHLELGQDAASMPQVTTRVRHHGVVAPAIIARCIKGNANAV